MLWRNQLAFEWYQYNGRGRSCPLKSWLQVTYPLLKAESFDTFCLVAPQLQETEKEVQLHLTKARHGLSNKPSTKVLHCP